MDSPGDKLEEASMDDSTVRVPGSTTAYRRLGTLIHAGQETRIDFHVVTNTDVYGLRLMTCDARQSALSFDLAFHCYRGGASHAYPQHIQPLECIIPPLLIGDPVKCHIVKQDIDAAAGQSAHRGLESPIERHEEIPAIDHAFVHRETVGVIDYVRRQRPDQKIDAEEQPGVWKR